MDESRNRDASATEAPPARSGSSVAYYCQFESRVTFLVHAPRIERRPLVRFVEHLRQEHEDPLRLLAEDHMRARSLYSNTPAKLIAQQRGLVLVAAASHELRGKHALLAKAK